MLDIRLLRDQPDRVKQRLAARGSGFDEAVDAVLACDTRRRSSQTRLQALQAERNKLSRQIGVLRGQGGETAPLEAEVRAQAAAMDELAGESAACEAEQLDLLLRIPNLPDETVPAGRNAAENPVVRTWGEISPKSDRPDHLEIAERLGLVDSARATKLSGSGFVCYVGAGARLERALVNFLLDLHTQKHGYVEISPPFLVRPDALTGTSQLPKFEEQLYRIERDDLYLIPTAEVPVTNLHREEIVTELPRRYAAYTPCFRREAGSAGVGTRGLIRMHQFDKVELVKICAPESSPAELESLTRDAEQVLQALNLPYRVIELCAGDLGFGAAKTYDLEVWAPGQNAYLEVSSCSNFGDYQARRMNLRCKDADGRNRFCHTLNGSGTALARLFVAILETGLRPDGVVDLPEALHKYFGGERIG